MSKDELKWFEQKWFVNLKIRTRLTLSFLFIAIPAAAIGAAGILFSLWGNIPHAAAFAVIIGVLSLLELAAALLLGSINAFLITDPTEKNERVIRKFATGSFNTSDTIRKRDWITAEYQDEIGSFSRRIKDIMAYLRNIDSCLKKISEGDLTAEVPVCSSDDEIGNSLSLLVENFHSLVGAIITTVDQVNTGARLVSDSSQSLAQGASEQASTVEELTASLEQISAQTRINAENAKQANTLAQTAKSNASEGNVQMKDMLKAMNEINLSSSDIGKVIKAIEDIAFQTNILALNAAVEAARAGQQGKGFAVVADEVRNLAGKSAEAAKETTAMIESSIKKVEAGTEIANRTAKALDEIVSQVDRAADFINSIATASDEQAHSLEQINVGIGQVSQVTQANAAAAEESAAASEELSGQAVQLKEHVSVFKI
jgi:methyl-accepting chemotaxis protein